MQLKGLLRVDLDKNLTEAVT